MTRSSPVVLALLGLALACTEPNPFAPAQDTGDSSAGDGDSSTGDPATGDGDGAPAGCGEPACSLSLELVEFSLQGDDTFSAELPKHAQQNTAPIAAVHRYDPGQSDNLGFAIAWTDNGDSWTVEVTTTGAAPNSRVAGVAAVIGLGEDFPAPEVEELTVTTADGCAALTSAPLDGRFVFDTVERYQPGDAAVFEFSRTASIADAASVEYCVSQPDNLDASLGVKLVALDLPEGALGVTASALLDSGDPASDSFAELDAAAQVVHLIGAQALTEAPEPSLGWQIDCAAQAPYACDYQMLGFEAGAVIEVGGAALASQ